MLPDDLERLLDGRVRGGPQGDLLGLALAAGQNLQVLGDGAARRLSETSVVQLTSSRVILSCSTTWHMASEGDNRTPIFEMLLHRLLGLWVRNPAMDASSSRVHPEEVLEAEVLTQSPI